MTVIISGDNGVSDVDGSAGTPAIRGTDANTGIFFGADQVGVATNGVERVEFGNSETVFNDSGASVDFRVEGDTDANLLFVDASADRLGVGTSSPSAKLHVVGGQSYVTGASGAGAYSRWYNNANTSGDFQVGQGFATASDSVALILNNANAAMVFGTNGTERARITSGGDFLVGTTSITNKFVVAGDSGGTAVARINNTTATGNVIGLNTVLLSNGNNTSSAHFQGTTDSVGNWYLFGNGTTSYSSDERLKKNIETTRDGYLQDICRLRVVKYNWKIDSDETPKELGLIAQEVEEVFPGLVQDDLNPVSKDDETIYKQLKQSVIPFMLLKSIQELKAINDAQASRIETLEAKVAALEANT